MTPNEVSCPRRLYVDCPCMPPVGPTTGHHMGCPPTPTGDLAMRALVGYLSRPPVNRTRGAYMGCPKRSLVGPLGSPSVLSKRAPLGPYLQTLSKDPVRLPKWDSRRPLFQMPLCARGPSRETEMSCRSRPPLGTVGEPMWAAQLGHL